MLVNIIHRIENTSNLAIYNMAQKIVLIKIYLTTKFYMVGFNGNQKNPQTNCITKKNAKWKTFFSRHTFLCDSFPPFELIIRPTSSAPHGSLPRGHYVCVCAVRCVTHIWHSIFGVPVSATTGIAQFLSLHIITKVFAYFSICYMDVDMDMSIQQ